MAFFQNPFSQEFNATWVVVNGTMGLPVSVRGNSGRGDDIVVSYGSAPFNFSGNDADSNDASNLVIWYSFAPYFNQWQSLTVSLGNGATTSVASVVSMLNADTNFAAWFTASATNNGQQVQIRSNRPSLNFRFYIKNGTAEEKLQFNKYAGVNDIPTYYNRHKVKHLLTTTEQELFIDNCNILIPLNPSNNVDAAIINNAVDASGKSLNFDSSDVMEDYEYLRGQSEQYIFKKIILDTSGNIAQIIEYTAGSRVGDMARKTCYFRNSGNAGAEPYQITQVPHVLETSDLIEPDCTEATDDGTGS